MWLNAVAPSPDCGKQTALCPGVSGMSHFNRRSLLLGSVSFFALPKSEPEQQYLFATDEYEIRMTLEYHDNEPNKGLRFQDRSTDRHFCLSPQGEENRHCAGSFNGSIAVARYRIASHVGPERSLLLREQVRSIDQSDRVPLRPPFERMIQVQHGLASDIQVFGYQADSSSPSSQEPDNAWCLLRQNLYLQAQSAPFLVVHWKHTLSSIRVLDIIPENGTWQAAQTGTRRR
jgi:hypothetical protein